MWWGRLRRVVSPNDSEPCLQGQVEGTPHRQPWLWCKSCTSDSCTDGCTYTLMDTNFALDILFVILVLCVLFSGQMVSQEDWQSSLLWRHDTLLQLHPYSSCGLWAVVNEWEHLLWQHHCHQWASCCQQFCQRRVSTACTVLDIWCLALPVFSWLW